MSTQISVSQTYDVRLDISAPETLWLGRFSHIEVWRSKLGVQGPYEEISSPDWAPARIPRTSMEPGPSPGARANISGKKLIVLVSGGGQYDVEFVGTDPFTFATAATQVTNSCRPYFRAYVDTKGKFTLETLGIGGSASLQVLGGDAAPLLGLPIHPPDNFNNGKEPHIPLVLGRTLYGFRDYYGSSDYFYKIRFREILSGAVSDFSEPILASARSGISSENLVVGFVQLVRTDGRPHTNQGVSVFSSIETGYQVEGFTVSSGEQNVSTDKNGYAEFLLVRGMEINVGISGMNMMRRVMVPTDPTVTSFDLLSPEYGKDDAFSVKRVDVPAAVKVTL